MRLKGKVVSLYAVGDRNRVLNTRGVLDGVYPEVFTVLVRMQGYNQRYSYSYNEVITNRVRVQLAARAAQG